MRKVIFYTRQNCKLCDEALALVQTIQELEAFELEIKDIYEEEIYLEKYHLLIPVVEIGENVLYGENLRLDQLLIHLKELASDN